jgi:hypothetical protein
LNLTTTAIMIDIEEFEVVFREPTHDDNIDDEGKIVEYNEGLVQEIRENQHLLGGRTFFERLLELLQIKCESYLARGTVCRC